MSLVHIDWHPDGPALRRFGRTVIIGSLLIAAVLWLAKGWATAALVLAVFGTVVGGLGLTGSRVALPGYQLWMGVAFVMGNVVSRVILAVVFYLVVTPLGLAARLIGRDRLALRARARARASHWVDLPQERTADHYERQF